MKLFDYQQRFFNKLLRFDRLMLFWPRKTGKSQVLIAILEYLILNNKNSNFLFITYSKLNTKIILSKIYKEIGSLIINKHRSDDYLYFINNNSCKFCIIEDCRLNVINSLTPIAILYDEFCLTEVDDLYILRDYIKMSNCKSIFTSTIIDLETLKLLDNNNDYYISIIPTQEDKIDLNKKIVELSYKPDYLLDYNDVIYQRKIKLKKLKEISNGI